MKIKGLTIIMLISSLFIINSCKHTDPLDSLKSNVISIEKLSQQSKDLKSAEDAFKLLRSLNKSLKGVRSAVVDIDEGKSKKDMKTITTEFDNYNSRIDIALKEIRKNTNQYKDDKNVQQITAKINKVLISQ